MSEINLEQIRKEVNPVYGTAQSCLQILSAVGDEDSDEMRRALGLPKFADDTKERAARIPPEVVQIFLKFSPAFTSTVEARFFSTNNFIQETGAGLVLDLPCGYTSRGIKLAGSGVRYIGADLPAVTEAVEPAVRKIIGENGNMTYTAVDATNYATLRKAVEGGEGELFITTEGLLMYFNQSELETVFANIRKLLLEFGGKWVTLDNELGGVTEKVIGALADGMSAGVASMAARIAAGAVSESAVTDNEFFYRNKERVRQFVSNMGFDLELVPISRYLPSEMGSFRELPEDKRAKAAAAFDSVNFWVMTARPDTAEALSCGGEDFKADVKLSDDVLNVTLAGRLDTITAPQLLSLYRQAEEGHIIKSLCIDMKELEYVSSAGLRALLMMKKALQSEKSFRVLNMSESVKEIFETTGFDAILI